MSSPPSFDLAFRQKGDRKDSLNPRDNDSSSSAQNPQSVQSGAENTIIPSPSRRSPTTAQDPHAFESQSEVTTTPAGAEATITTAQQPKGVKFAPHITLISHEGDSKRVPWNPFASQTSIEPLEQVLGPEQSNPNIRTQPSQLTLAEFLRDESNLPPHLRPRQSLLTWGEFLKDESNLTSHLASQPSSGGVSNKLGSSAQDSVVSLNQILNEGPPVLTAETGLKDISNEGPPVGLQRSVSKRVVDKVRSLVATSSKSTTTPSGSATSREENEEKDDEHYTRSQQEAQTSISIGLDGSYLFDSPPAFSHQALTTTTKPLPLPPRETSDSKETVPFAAPPSTTHSRPRSRGRSRNATIRPSYEVIAPYLPRARTSSTETIKARQTSATIGVMSPSVDDTGRAERIPLVCPAWDRRVDVSWSRDQEITWSGARELNAFRVSLAQFHREAKHTPTKNDLVNPLLQLPDRVRYMICKYLVPDHPDQKPIKLNNGMWLYEPVWPAVYFDNLADVLRSVSDYTSVCWAMRADVLTTILNTRRFHVVLSPFSGALLDPLANLWFGKYAGYIQHVTIELDCTKLGFGAEPAAVNLRPLVIKLTPRIETYAVAQKMRGIQQQLLLHGDGDGFFGEVEKKKAAPRGGRGGLSTVHSLTVAARRYFGERPAEAGRVPQKYSPDEYLAVLGPVKALCGKVDNLRAVGLDAGSTYRLLALVWEGMTAESVKAAVAGRFGAVRATCPSDFYPTLPGQASFFDDGTGGDSGNGVFIRHPFAFDDGRLGFYLDESMIGEARQGTVHSSILPSALRGTVEPAAKKVKGLPGWVSGREKGKGKAGEEREKEEAPEWPEEREDEEGEGEEVKSRGSSTDTEPFPELPDMNQQLALLEAYQFGSR
ncbi:hypothetical protein BR93DRAFT_969550 [Coniochaeta sp. PMI_546]|nr:hypothetical protein BR93DRAFT_969550 [Coniochaeta sp. PMI_546]